MLERIRIVLIGTSHPGNIGGVARAMHNMGLADLALVAPRCDVITQDSISRASGADHLLHQATVHATLEEAVADCTLAVGASARSRTLPWPMISPRELAERLPGECQPENARVALVFGRENNGLTNEELQQCHFHVCIPANPDYSSLNLAAAVQTLCYEIRMAFLNKDAIPTEETEYPLNDDLERFYVHLESTLKKVSFINENHPGIVMTRLRRLFNRARPESQELNILRGILASVDKSAEK